MAMPYATTAVNNVYAGAEKEPEKMTALSTVSSANSATDGVAARLHEIAHRLVGGWPQKDSSKDGDVSQATGILNEISAQADAICSRCRDMHEALNAIERQLP